MPLSIGDKFGHYEILGPWARAAWAKYTKLAIRSPRRLRQVTCTRRSC